MSVGCAEHWEFPWTCRIFQVLGRPTPEGWPTLRAHPHWRDNTEGVQLSAARHQNASMLTEHVRNQVTVASYRLKPPYECLLPIPGSSDRSCRPSEEQLCLTEKTGS